MKKLTIGFAITSVAAASLWLGLRSWSPPRPASHAGGLEEPRRTSGEPVSGSVAGSVAPVELGVLRASARRMDLSSGSPDPTPGDPPTRFLHAATHAPLAGVQIHNLGGCVVYDASARSGVFRPVEPPLAASDSDGHAALTDEVFAAPVVAYREGYVPLRLRRVDAGQAVVLEPCDGARVMVQSADGQSLSGAVLAIRGTDLGWEDGAPATQYVRVAVADAFGQARLPSRLAAGALVLVGADGYAITPLTWSGKPADVRVRLRPTARLVGRVIPVSTSAGLAVEAQCLDAGLGVPLTSPVTAEGSFEITAAARGLTYKLSVTSPGVWGSVAISTPVSIGAPASGIELPLPSTCTLIAEVVSSDPSRKATRPAVLIAPCEGGALPGAGAADATLRSDGVWEWPAARAASQQLVALSVKADGHAPVAVGQHRLVQGRTIDLGRVELVPEHRWDIEVVARDDGVPIGAAEVTFAPYPVEGSMAEPILQREICGADGRCALFCVPQGGTLVVRGDGYTEVQRQVAPLSPLRAETTRVVLDRAARIALTVVDANEAPVPGASIRWSHVGTTTRGHARTDTRGRAEFDTPAGTIRVIHSPRLIRRRVGSMQSLATSRGTDDETLAEVSGLQPGEIRSVAAEVSALTELEVRLVDQDGEPQAGCRVWAMPGTGISIDDLDDIGTIAAPSGVSGDDGSATLHGVASGLTTFFVESVDRTVRWASVHEVDADTAVLHLSLDRDDVELRVVDRAGNVVAGVAVEAVIEWGGRRFVRVVDRATGQSDEDRSGPPRQVAISDSDGVARFVGLPVGCVLKFQPSDPVAFPTTEPTVLGRGDRDSSAELTIGSGASVTVQLAPDDSKSAVVWLESAAGLRSEETDANGEARFHMLSPGDFSVRVLPHGWERAINLEPGERLLLSVHD